MKKALKLIPALAMLLVSAILVSTTTYAWFSMNNKVTVTGMQVKTKVNSNLLIDDVANGHHDSEYVAGITQVRKGILEPASTTDGVNFWYTLPSNVAGDGDAKTDSYVKYGTEDDGYINYVRGANIAGFIKVANAMLEQGIC